MLKYRLFDETDGEGSDLPGDEAAAAAARGDFVEEEPVEEKIEDKEPDVEAKLDEEGEEGEEGEKEDKKPAQNIMIPKSRLDVKNREIERLRKELEARTKPEDEGDEVDIDAEMAAINKEMADAIKDADTAKFVELQGRRDQLLREEISSTGLAASETATTSARESIRLDSTIDIIESRIPELNQDHESFDEGLSEEVMDLYETLLSSDRYKPADALARSVKLITGKDYTAAIPESKKTPAKKTTDIEKNLKAAGGQGPDVSDVGKDSSEAGVGDDIQPSKLTMDEFEALPDSVKSRLRGDEVAA